MNERLIDQLVQLHMAQDTDPHPPSWPIDPEYASAYEVVVATLATLRS